MKRFSAFFALALLALFSLPALHAQIFVTSNSSILRYNLDGTGGTTLASGLNGPQGLAVSGSTLFTFMSGSQIITSSNFDGTGSVTLVSSGLATAQGIAASGSYIFVTDFAGGTAGAGSVRRYDHAGLNEITLVSGLTGPFEIAVSGSDIFVTNRDSIGKYNINTGTGGTLVTGLANNPLGIAVSGSHVFMTSSSDFVLDFNASTGALTRSWTAGGQGSYGIAATSSEVYVTNYTPGTVSRFQLDGTLLDTAFISGLPNTLGIAVSPIPEPSTYAALAGFTTLALAAWRRKVVARCFSPRLEASNAG